MKGICLSELQGKYIIEGKKKMLVLPEKPPKDFYDTDVIIIEDEKILGTLRLAGETGPIPSGTVRSNLRVLHNISDEDWDKLAEKDPKFNQSVYTITFSDVKPWDEPTLYDKSKVEGEYWLSNIEVHVEESHSRFKCMNCDEPPTVEILWAEGKAHAWFCTPCYKEWEQADDMHEINYEREIYGVASKTWKEGPLSEEKAKEERKALEGINTSDDVLHEEPEKIIESTLEEDILGFTNLIMPYLETELRKMVEDELKKLVKEVAEEKTLSAQDQYLQKKIELVDQMKKILERGGDIA